MIVGYARVSTKDQSLELQLDALQKAGCRKFFTEKVSGTSRTGREKLTQCLDYIRDGDTLVVTRIDRLARSMRDLQNIAHDLNRQGINLIVTEQNVDTSTSAGRAFFNMLGVFAEFETDLRKERQMEGIAKAKKAGKYKGRKPSMHKKTDEVMKLLEVGTKKAEIARLLGISRQTVYRIISKVKASTSKGGNSGNG